MAEEQARIEVEITSSLVPHPPIISTILDTTSFLSTITETLTRELLVNFHGKKLPTQILDVEVKVQTVTSVISSTLEITPTPSWQTLTITKTLPPVSPTHSPSPAPVISNIQASLAQQKQQQNNKNIVDD